MLRHLIHFLLIFGMAIPAAAMPLCHVPAEQPVSAGLVVHMQHGVLADLPDADRHAPPNSDSSAPQDGTQHGCIGCALPMVAETVPDTGQVISTFGEVPLVRLVPANPGPDVPPPRG
jgi:hypothetical protein